MRLLGPETAGIPPPKSTSKNTLSPQVTFESFAESVILGAYAGTTSILMMLVITYQRNY